MNPFISSLWISLISMGLVFVSLILLAGLMSVMTQLFRDRPPAAKQSVPPPAEKQDDDKLRAAALAVAVALAVQKQSTANPLASLKPTIIGAWQLGMRTRHMTQKSVNRNRHS